MWRTIRSWANWSMLTKRTATRVVRGPGHSSDLLAVLTGRTFDGADELRGTGCSSGAKVKLEASAAGRSDLMIACDAATLSLHPRAALTLGGPVRTWQAASDDVSGPCLSSVRLQSGDRSRWDAAASRALGIVRGGVTSSGATPGRCGEMR